MHRKGSSSNNEKERDLAALPIGIELRRCEDGETYEITRWENGETYKFTAKQLKPLFEVFYEALNPASKKSSTSKSSTSKSSTSKSSTSKSSTSKSSTSKSSTSKSSSDKCEECKKTIEKSLQALEGGNR